MPISQINTNSIATGAVAAADLASTLDLTGKTVTLPAGVGGKVLQVVSATKTNKQSTTSATPTDITGLSVTITPTNASNKILVLTDINYGGDLNVYGGFYIKRGASNIVVGSYPTGNQVATTFGVGGDNNNHQYKLNGVSHSYLDSPNTTGATTYKVQFAVTNTGGSTLTINAPHATDNADYIIGGTSTITVMEIAA